MPSDPLRLDDETIHRLAGTLALRLGTELRHAVHSSLETALPPVAAPPAVPAPPQDEWAAAAIRDEADNRATQLVMQLVLRVADSCVDVGANVGRVLEDIVRMAPEGRHVAFEPIPDHAADLRRRFPQVDVRESALAAEPGRSEFVLVPEETGYSGLRERPYPAGVTTRRIPVEIERLDDALPADMAPRLVKVDVEGGELGVFRGGVETLSRHRPIVIFEHGPGASRAYGAAPEDIYDVLAAECGLRLYDLDGEGPFSRDEFAERAWGGATWNWLAHG